MTSTPVGAAGCRPWSCYVVGTGGAGRETLDVALALGRAVTAFVDERPRGTVVRGLPVRLPSEASPGAAFVIGIADGAVRGRLGTSLMDAGRVPEALVHPRRSWPRSRPSGGAASSWRWPTSAATCASAPTSMSSTAPRSATTACSRTSSPSCRARGSAASVRLGAGCTVGSGAVVLQGRTGRARRLRGRRSRRHAGTSRTGSSSSGARLGRSR